MLSHSPPVAGRSSLLLIATSTVVVVGSAATLFWFNKKKRRQDDENNKINNKNNKGNNSTKKGIDLPPHLKREIHKEQRRQISIRWMAMKKPMYDNIEMYGPTPTKTTAGTTETDDDTTTPPLLCTISEKKAKWYVKKNLAIWIIDENDENVDSGTSSCPSRKIQLLFTPKGGDRPGSTRSNSSSSNQNGCNNNDENYKIVDQSTSSSLPASNATNYTAAGSSKPATQIKEYNTSHKHNICVACGDDKHFMRHYIIPYCYRTLLPQKYKSHMPHDIVILCPDCHVICEQQTQLKQKYIETKLRTHVEQQLQIHQNKQKQMKFKLNNSKDKDDQSIDTSKSVILNRDLYHVKSCATALIKFKQKLPQARIEEYETTIRDYYYYHQSQPQLNDNGNQEEKENEEVYLLELTNELLQETTKLETTISNPYYIPGPRLVVDSLLQMVLVLMLR